MQLLSEYAELSPDKHLPEVTCSVAMHDCSAPVKTPQHDGPEKNIFYWYSLAVKLSWKSYMVNLINDGPQKCNITLWFALCSATLFIGAQ